MTAPFISTDNASCEDVAGSLDDPKSQGRVKLHTTSARNCVKEKRLQSLNTRLESNGSLNKKWGGGKTGHVLRSPTDNLWAAFLHFD